MITKWMPARRPPQARAALARCLALAAVAAISLAGVVASAWAAPQAGIEPQRIEFPNVGDRTPATLTAMMFRPAGAGPFPAVVALHGCSGLWSEKDPAAVSPRDLDWAKALVGDGFVVLFPDSFGSRGLGPQCKNSEREVSPARERVADADAALAYLQSLPVVKPDSIALLGWSNGGSSVLYAVRPKDKPKGKHPDFRLAVAFYPGCREPYHGGEWSTRIPLMILIGEADNWTPAAPCKELAAAAGTSVTLITYPQAYHDFDNAAQPVHTLHGLAFTADGSGNAKAGLNPAARADAFRRVPEFLAAGLGRGQ
jgi:dienelactone hydrolase